MRTQYEEGQSLFEIGLRYGGLTAATVAAAVRKNGGTIRTRNSGIRRGKQVVRDHGDEMLRRYESGEMLAVIAAAYAITETTVAAAIRKRGGIIRKRGFGSAPESWRGPLNPNWRGGRYVKEGYVHVKIPADHPLAVMRNTGGYVLEHRLLMAQAINRPLAPDETVHHIDGDKLNNAASNLQLRQGRHGNGSRWFCSDCGSHNVVAGGL